MYDIKSIETGQRTINTTQNFLTNYFQQIPSNNNNNNKLNKNNICKSISSTISQNKDINTTVNMSLRRRRIFQRQTCLISIMIAFAFGLTLGVFVPIIGISTVFTSSVDQLLLTKNHNSHNKSDNLNLLQLNNNNNNDNDLIPKHPVSDFPTIYELQQENVNDDQQILSINNNNNNKNVIDTYSVSFVNDNNNNNNDINNNNKKLPVEEVFRNAFHLEQDKLSDDTMIVKKLDANDGSIKEYRVQRTSDGMFRKGPEHRISKPSVIEQVLSINNNNNINDQQQHDNSNDKLKISGSSVKFVPIKNKNTINLLNNQYHQNQFNNYIKDDIYWGDLIEKSIPIGYNDLDADKWNNYLKSSSIVRLENGCGRMQNRLVIFSDGKRACARYRQNTDQIQGELFSFYLGRLLNLTNLAPSSASVIDLDTILWSQAINDIQIAQWKSTRPVVLTKWLPDLEPAGIPIAFQPLERHLNKYDVWNITLGMTGSLLKENEKNYDQNENILNNNKNRYRLQKDQVENKKGLLKRLGANLNNINNNNNDQSLNQSADIIIDSLDSSSNNNNQQLSLQQQNNITNITNNIENILNNNNNQLNNNTKILNRLIELAQWSDLIIFDYLIANLDRVVNNLYNYQWNADIMAAPAHNLARQINTQLLIFLDNESGLLHGYRLLKKYEAYHGLLLDNLCVFRQPTINSLKNLREYGVGHQLQELFERSTSHQLRDVLPSLPDKSIKILNDRIDRVLGQVQKCRDLFSDR